MTGGRLDEAVIHVRDRLGSDLLVKVIRERCLACFDHEPLWRVGDLASDRGVSL